MHSISPSPTAPADKPGWFDDQYVAIDQGPILLMIENFLTGRIWSSRRATLSARRPDPGRLHRRLARRRGPRYRYRCQGHPRARPARWSPSRRKSCRRRRLRRSTTVRMITGHAELPGRNPARSVPRAWRAPRPASSAMFQNESSSLARMNSTSAGLTRRQPDALEAFELTHRSRHAGAGQADVALDHLGPFAFARVRDAGADLDRRAPVLTAAALILRAFGRGRRVGEASCTKGRSRKGRAAHCAHRYNGW